MNNLQIYLYAKQQVISNITKLYNNKKYYEDLLSYKFHAKYIEKLYKENTDNIEKEENHLDFLNNLIDNL